MVDDSNKVDGHFTDCTSSDSLSSSESDSEDENYMSYETLLANSQFIAQAYKVCKQNLKDVMTEISKLKLSQSDSHTSSDYDSERIKFLSEIEKIKKENES